MKKPLFKQFRYLGLLVLTVMLAAMVAACGDSTTATTAPAASTAAATTAAPTAAATTAAVATTTAPATTSAAAGTTTAVATSAATGTTAAAGTGATSGKIVIYSSLPMTGSSKEQIDTVINAAKLALADFTGGTNKIGNFTIEYIPLDDATAAKGKWDADQEKANANKAAADADAMVYLGTFNSGAAVVSIPILNQAGMAMISPSNTKIGLTRQVAGITDQGEPDIYYPTKTRNYFRIVGDDDLQGAAAARFLASLGNVKKVYTIDDSEAYGVGLVTSFQTYCKQVNLDCTARKTIKGTESDYKSNANEIAAAKVDAIYYGGTTQNNVGTLIKDIRAAGITVPFMGGDGILEDAYTDTGSATEGTYGTVAGVESSKLPAKGQEVIKRYKEKYGNVQAYTIYGYEMMSVALNAIKTAGVKDRKAIVAALAKTKDFDGVLGKWSFTETGDISIPDYQIQRVTDGKWKYLQQAPLK